MFFTRLRTVEEKLRLLRSKYELAWGCNALRIILAATTDSIPPEAHALQDVIETYAKRLARSPFLPHMTVLSGVKGLTAEESTAKLTTLADSMHQLEVKIDMVAFKVGYEKTKRLFLSTAAILLKSGVVY
ncbi:hypothetical protein PsorP6_002608 [Peronosclerospora sorghi]|uniref:Uncharacterized protein n=1 Tax=Peronosclerospora sorghi TaxID=230839 RepID=A0ACC0WVS7_9STRA|nr:hypothetical protein PsorP6_002608 [Peronosclerospora sorghi]